VDFVVHGVNNRQKTGQNIPKTLKKIIPPYLVVEPNFLLSNAKVGVLIWCRLMRSIGYIKLPKSYESVKKNILALNVLSRAVTHCECSAW